MTRIERLIAIAAAFAAVSLGGCAGNNSMVSNMTGSGLAAMPQSTLANPNAGEYQIGPTDKLAITILPDKTMSIDGRVSSDGTILVPSLGRVKAAGRTQDQLTQDIQTGLKACCLQDPQVAVEVTETTSQQITVMGAVKAPNSYTLRGRTTLVQAVAMAGGEDPQKANLQKVGIRRTLNGQVSGQVFNLREILAGRAENPQIYPGDLIIVDTSEAKSAWRTMLEAIPITSVLMAF